MLQSAGSQRVRQDLGIERQQWASSSTSNFGGKEGTDSMDSKNFVHLNRSAYLNWALRVDLF